MANKTYADVPYDCNRSHRDYDQVSHKKPHANKLPFTLAQRDHISEKEYHENYFDPSKPKLSHRPSEDYRSRISHPEGNPGFYNESAYDEYGKNHRPSTSSARTKKAIDVRRNVKHPDPVMKRPTTNVYQPVRELPVQSKISLDKYEKNLIARMDDMKRRDNLTDIRFKIRELAQQKKNKSVNFQDIPVPIEYQEMSSPKTSKTSSDDYQTHHDCQEDQSTESSNVDDVGSLYEDNNQFDDDTQSEANSYCHEIPQIRESIVNLEKGRDYLYGMMNQTITNLKTHEKRNGYSSKKTDSCAAGDNRTNQSGGSLLKSDCVIKKIEAVKLDCYKKIENNLIRLKDIDDVTTKLYQNYVDEANTNK
ncbi:unnamed protein product [Diamesa hyperborea]